MSDRKVFQAPLSKVTPRCRGELHLIEAVDDDGLAARLAHGCQRPPAHDRWQRCRTEIVNGVDQGDAEHSRVLRDRRASLRKKFRYSARAPPAATRRRDRCERATAATKSTKNLNSGRITRLRDDYAVGCSFLNRGTALRCPFWAGRGRARSRHFVSSRPAAR